MNSVLTQDRRVSLFCCLLICIDKSVLSVRLCGYLSVRLSILILSIQCTSAMHLNLRRSSLRARSYTLA